METKDSLVTSTHSKFSSNPKVSTPNPIQRVFVGSLPANTNKKELLDIMRQYADVKDITLAIGSNKNNEVVCKGFAFITCIKRAGVLELLRQNSILQYKGRNLTLREFKTGEQLHREMYQFNERRVFVGNICSTVQLDELWHLFSKYGPIENVYLVNDEGSKKSKFGYVIMKDSRDADLIVSQTWSMHYKGRLLKLSKFSPDIRYHPKIDNETMWLSSKKEISQKANYISDKNVQTFNQFKKGRNLERLTHKRGDQDFQITSRKEKHRVPVSTYRKSLFALNQNRPFQKASETYLRPVLIGCIILNQISSANMRFNRRKRNEDEADEEPMILHAAKRTLPDTPFTISTTRPQIQQIQSSNVKNTYKLDLDN